MDGQMTAACAGRAAYDTVKRSLFADLRGTVLEIGAGKGANFGLLPGQVRWVGLEPAGRRRRRLARGHAGVVLAGIGEQIPLRDHSVDAVISTIVLCSVRDQDRVLTEVRRVLRPGGVFVFCEHVAAPAGPRAGGSTRWPRGPAGSTLDAIRAARPGSRSNGQASRTWSWTGSRFPPSGACTTRASPGAPSRDAR